MFKRLKFKSGSVWWMCLCVCLFTQTSSAGPIHSDVAFTPRKGGTILRLQYAYFEASGKGGNVQHVNGSTFRGVLVHGLHENVALILAVPYINQQVDKFVPRLGRVEDTKVGFADFSLLLKYRFWQNDMGPRHTERWAVLAGVNIRSGDSDFTSDSYDPMIGTVYTWRKERHLIDADLVYQINTGGGARGNDNIRYDFAYSYRLISPVDDSEELLDVWYEWNIIAELNGKYNTNGSHEIYLSPGLQYVTERWVWELSVQLPVVQDIVGDGPETDYRVVTGIRIRW